VVDLHETCLASARFESADFTNADMSGAVLAGARITGKVTVRILPNNGDLNGPTQFLDEPSDFTGANLTGADLSGIQVMCAVFENAQLSHVDMRNISPADLGGGAVCPAAVSKDFTAMYNDERVHIARAGEIIPYQLGLFLDGAYLESANFAGTNLGDTSFRGANLLCADFTDAEIGDAWFEGVWAMSDAEVREILKSHPVPCK
jgi:uncharacterized protein YjbI with pentapeptide repeats